jgi:hypothetical protein
MLITNLIDSSSSRAGDKGIGVEVGRCMVAVTLEVVVGVRVFVATGDLCSDGRVVFDEGLVIAVGGASILAHPAR